MIPDGYKVVRVGWVREHIGYAPLPGPGHEDYKPMTKPQKTFSEPKRWIEIGLYEGPLTCGPIRIWDDGSEEFNRAYADADSRGIKAVQEVND